MSTGEAIAAAPSPVDAIAAIERRVGGRLGVFAFDTAGGARIEHRAYEPFPMCSTFKLLAASAVLSRVDRGELSLDQPVAYRAADLLDHAPDTKAHVAEGSMKLGALCAAAVEDSDNTAANLLLVLLGGRDGFNGFARSLGDRFTQLDRNEPALNEALPGDTRDCTTPSAMAKDAQKLVLGNALSPASRARLEAWLFASTTGGTRLRAGFPTGWRIGDKTGTGLHGTSKRRRNRLATQPGADRHRRLPHRLPRRRRRPRRSARIRGKHRRRRVWLGVSHRAKARSAEVEVLRGASPFFRRAFARGGASGRPG